MLLKILRQVSGQVLEHEGETGLGVDDVVERDDVGVLQVLQQTGLADSSEGGALLLLQPYLLQSHHLVGQVAEPLEHGGVASLAQLLQFYISIQLAIGRVTSECRVSLAATSEIIIITIKEHFRLGSLRLLGSHDHVGHHLLLDLLVQES